MSRPKSLRRIRFRRSKLPSLCQTPPVPDWEGFRNYRILVRVDPADIGTRTGDERPAQLTVNLQAVLQSQFELDGIVDMGAQSITVPAGGLNITGYNFDVSQLTSSAAAYTMFISDGGGSGNVIGKDYAIDVSGAGSKVYDLTAANPGVAFEFARINYNNCT